MNTYFVPVALFAIAEILILQFGQITSLRAKNAVLRAESAERMECIKLLVEEQMNREFFPLPTK